MKKLIHLSIITTLLSFSGCSSYNYTHKPTLQEKQEMYHSTNKPFKAKDILIIAFWVPTIFIMSYACVISIKK